MERRIDRIDYSVVELSRRSLRSSAGIILPQRQEVSFVCDSDRILPTVPFIAFFPAWEWAMIRTKTTLHYFVTLTIVIFSTGQFTIFKFQFCPDRRISVRKVSAFVGLYFIGKW
jgi:hypothetical protein